jgi:hypothetical protein
MMQRQTLWPRCECKKNPFYIDDKMLIPNGHFYLERTATTLYKYFIYFRLSMHVENTTKKSETVAIVYDTLQKISNFLTSIRSIS